MVIFNPAPIVATIMANKLRQEREELERQKEKEKENKIIKELKEKYNK